MDARDDRDDLHDVEQRLIGARLELSPLEEDALRRRVSQRVQGARPASGRFAGLRRRGLATLLVSGAVLTSGASVVMATGTTSSTPSVTYTTDSAGCQYHKSFTLTLTFTSYGKTTTVKIAYDCKTNKFTITITCTKVITYYYCNGKKITVPGSSKTTTFTVDPGPQTIVLGTSDGGTMNLPLPLVVP